MYDLEAEANTMYADVAIYRNLMRTRLGVTERGEMEDLVQEALLHVLRWPPTVPIRNKVAFYFTLIARINAKRKRLVSYDYEYNNRVLLTEDEYKDVLVTQEDTTFIVEDIITRFETTEERKGILRALYLEDEKVFSVRDRFNTNYCAIRLLRLRFLAFAGEQYEEISR